MAIQSERENFFKTLEFNYPEWIPFSVGIAWPLWHKYREKLEDIILRFFDLWIVDKVVCV